MFKPVNPALNSAAESHVLYLYTAHSVQCIKVLSMARRLAKGIPVSLPHIGVANKATRMVPWD